MDYPIATYAQFWPYYRREPLNPRLRAVHYRGTALALGLLMAAVAAIDARCLLGAIVARYSWASIGHVFDEHSGPATFTNTVWSLASAFHRFRYGSPGAWTVGSKSPRLAVK